MPTAPESLPTRRSSAAASKRVRLRCVSRIPKQKLQPECGRLCVDAVSAADDRRVFELKCSLLQRLREAKDTGANVRRGFLELEGLRRIDNIRGC